MEELTLHDYAMMWDVLPHDFKMLLAKAVTHIKEYKWNYKK